MEFKFCFDEKRKTGATCHMILMMAKYGNHGHRQRFASDADVKRFFQSKGCSWEALVQDCRNPNRIVPIVENLIGSTWVVSGSGKAAVVAGATTEHEKEIASVEGPGILSFATYLQLFENAVDSLSRSMEKASFSDLQSCVTNGMASIDAYIMHRAFLYNSNNPATQLVDSRDNKVPQDTKIDEWIPKMLKGNKLDKSGVNWRDFRTLRSIRDDLAIHLKKPAVGISYQQLEQWLNLFRSGIAGLLFDLHLLFDERVPCKIIRYMYAPDIRLGK